MIATGLEDPEVAASAAHSIQSALAVAGVIVLAVGSIVVALIGSLMGAMSKLD